MKLLRAFIEAQGYEIEEIIGKKFAGAMVTDEGQEDRFIDAVIDYKVTKKNKELTTDEWIKKNFPDQNNIGVVL